MMPFIVLAFGLLLIFLEFYLPGAVMELLEQQWSSLALSCMLTKQNP